MLEVFPFNCSPRPSSWQGFAPAEQPLSLLLLSLSFFLSLCLSLRRSLSCGFTSLSVSFVLCSTVSNYLSHFLSIFSPRSLLLYLALSLSLSSLCLSRLLAFHACPSLCFVIPLKYKSTQEIGLPLKARNTH